MKNPTVLFVAISLLALAGCSGTSTTAQKKPVTNPYTESNNTCSAQAEKKLGLFDRPDTYPISSQERDNARAALYNECMSAHEPKVAGAPKSDTQQANAQSAAAFAALKPAAGGNSGRNGSGFYPSGSTVIMVQGNDVSQLGALSPSAGGNPSQSGVTGAYPGATVVVVQAPGAQAQAGRPAPEMPTALAKPIAVPPQPVMATAHNLAAPPAQAPKTMPAQSSDQDSKELEQILTK